MPVSPRVPLAVVISAIDKLSGPLASIGSKLSGFGRSARRVGGALTLGLTTPLVALGAAAFQAGADFEASMKRVEVLSGATGDALEQLAGQAKDLGRTTQFAASQAAEAQQAFALAGFDTLGILEATPAALNLAAAAQIELGLSAQFVAGVLRAGQLPMTKAASTADLITAAFTKSTNTAETVVEAYTKVGPAAASMKIPIEEVFQAIAILGDNMIDASTAGTSMRNLLIRLASPTAEVRRALESLEIPLEELVDQAGNVRSLSLVFDRLRQSGAGLREIAAIAGVKAAVPIQTLVNTTSERIAELDEVFANFGGTAERVAAKQMEGAKGALAEMRSAFEALGIAIADSGLLEWATKAIREFTGWVQSLSKAELGTLKNITAVGALAAALGPFVLVVGTAISATGSFLSLISLLSPAAAGLATLLSAKLVPAIRAVTAAMAANPIGLILIGIAALVGWIISASQRSDEFRNTWQVMWGDVERTFRSATDFILKRAVDVAVVLDNIAKFIPGVRSTPAGVDARKFATALAEAKLAEFLGTPVPGGGGRGQQAPARALIPPERLSLATLNEVRLPPQQRVTVAFEDVPEGVRIRSDRTNDIVDLDLGFSMASQ